MEPKKDLIERVVRVIGKKKAIELLSETATIEQTGGLYTVVRPEIPHKILPEFSAHQLRMGYSQLVLFVTNNNDNKLSFLNLKQTQNDPTSVL